MTEAMTNDQLHATLRSLIFDHAGDPEHVLQGVVDLIEPILAQRQDMADALVYIENHAAFTIKSLKATGGPQPHDLTCRNALQMGKTCQQALDILDQDTLNKALEALLNRI